MGRPRESSVRLGEQFGRLTVTRETKIPGSKGGSRAAECRCQCGNAVIVRLNNLLGGRTQSCGCLQRARLSQRAATHGVSAHPLYYVWKGMMGRCYNPRAAAYRYYGGRGITVCEWWHDAANFIYWIEKNLGPRPPGMTLDRKRNGLGYKPSNVKWSSTKEQRRN